MIEERTIACDICGEQTRMLSTKLCDRCWELKVRIELNPVLAQRILESLTLPATTKEGE